MLILLLALSINANATDLYEQKSSMERKQGSKSTAFQKAKKDLAPIFRCTSKAIHDKNDNAIRSTCLERIAGFEKKAGKKFSKSKYPTKALKKMVNKIRKYDAFLDEQARELEGPPQIER